LFSDIWCSEKQRTCGLILSKFKETIISSILLNEISDILMYKNERFIKLIKRPRKLIDYAHKKSSDLVLGSPINLFCLLKQVDSVEGCTEGSMAQFSMLD
jgi:hypothetical protein